MPEMTFPTTMSFAKPAKFKTPTCALCRRRKLRCDGGDPCGPCSRTRTPVTCTYVPKTVGQLRSELPKGGACRCDGQKPCRTCTQTSRPDECQYRETGQGRRKPLKPAPHEDQSSSDSTSNSSSSRPTTPSHIEITNECLDLPHRLAPFLRVVPRITSNIPRIISGGSKGSPGFPFTLPSLDSVSSALQVNPLPQDKDCHAESFTARNVLLEHGWQYGLSVTTEKREALCIGDLSSLIVDPTLVNVCELMGYLVRLHSHPEAWLPFNSQTAVETELDLLIRHKLESVSGRGSDPLLCLQAYTLLSLYSAQKEDIHSCQEFLVKASNIVVHHAATLGLQDASADTWCPKLDASAAFSQMIYLDIECGLILNLPSVIDPGLLENFRLQVATHWTDTEINFMRAKGILFLSDSQQLVGAWSRWDLGDPAPTAWSKRYWALIDEIHSHITFLKTALVDVACIPALRGAQPTLKTCVITALAALVELYGLFAASQPEWRRKHCEAVAEICNITRGFSDKDYEYLDPILGVCWSIACRTLYDVPEWDVQGCAPYADGISRSTLLFFHECNRKLRRASPFAIPL
ncbi:hypothetical protein B0H13DRAFT_2014768 [Mycena leptocephala]|nr:hypothetical protein B0H13DRAFT_2014768 [Mycena leptocephala]